VCRRVRGTALKKKGVSMDFRLRLPVACSWCDAPATRRLRPKFPTLQRGEIACGPDASEYRVSGERIDLLRLVCVGCGASVTGLDPACHDCGARTARVA